MTDDHAPTGIRRQFLVWLAYVRIGFWVLKEAGCWYRPSARRRL